MRITETGDDASGNPQVTPAYYMFKGHADRTRLISDKGDTLENYYYDAFGTPIDSQESISNPFKYSGYQHDSETGTYYIKCRMDDPATARFL